LAAQHLPPAILLAALNDQLQERKLDAQYVTMLMALWDDENQTIQIANAGSVQPLYVTGAHASMTDAIEVTTIHAEGFPLGLFTGAAYDEIVITAQPGDLLVFFSDGIVDAGNSHGEMFGDERLIQLLRRHPTARQSAQSAVDAILEAVSEFRAGNDHFDDETVVVLRVI
jgi:sigma-B regulation protein RsbU (phosphoserine phosphatase)